MNMISELNIDSPFLSFRLFGFGGVVAHTVYLQGFVSGGTLETGHG